MNWLTVQMSKAQRSESRRQMIDKLVEEGDEQAVRFLIGFLKDKDQDVRCGAVQALGKLKSPDAVPELIPLLQDPDASLREWTVAALADIGDPSCTDALIPLLGDDHFAVRRRTAQTLGTFHWLPKGVEQRLLWALGSGDYEMAAKDCGKLAVEPLIILMKEKDSPDRNAIMSALGKILDDRVPAALSEALSDLDTSMRVAAAETFGDCGDMRAIDPLVAALEDPEPTVRAAVAGALGKIGSPRGVNSLIAALNDDNWDVRRAAVQALGQVRDGRGVPPLLELLKDNDYDVRHAAVRSLGQIGNKSASKHLIEALVDPQVTVRQAAAEALAIVDRHWETSPAAQAALVTLQTALESQEYWVRYAATDVLKRITEANKTGQLSNALPAPVYHKQTVALEALLSALGDWDRDLRQAAAEALGRLGDPRAFEPLKNCSKDTDDFVRESAKKALLSMGWTPGEHTTSFAKK